NAEYDANENTVSFYATSNALWRSEIALSGAYYYMAETPSLSGYTFAGWTDTSTSNTATWLNAQQGKTTTEDVSWYAVWVNNGESYELTNTHTFYTNTAESTIFTQRIVKFRGTYYNYDRTVSSSSDNAIYDTGIEYQTATKENYTFVGWTDNPDSYLATWTGSYRTSEVDTTWYAVWNSNSSTPIDTFTHTFNTDAGESFTTETQSTTNASNSFNYNLTQSSNNQAISYSGFSMPSASRTGYTLIGWTSDNSGYYIERSVGSYSSPTTSTVWYAVWRQIAQTVLETYTHTFHIDSSSSNDYERSTHKYSNTYTDYSYDLSEHGDENNDITYETISAPTTSANNNKTFVGWSPNSNGTIVNWNIGYSKNPTENTTWYAVYKTSGTQRSVVTELIHVFNETSSSHYTTTSTSTTTFYCDVYYNYTEEETRTENYSNSVTTYSQIVLPEISVAYDGYKVAGWTQAFGTTNVHEPSSTYTPRSYTVWYAVMKRDLTETVRYSTDYGDTPATQIANYTIYYNYDFTDTSVQTTNTTLPTFENFDGYEFIGWSSLQGGEVEYDGSQGYSFFTGDLSDYTYNSTTEKWEHTTSLFARWINTNPEETGVVVDITIVSMLMAMLVLSVVLTCKGFKSKEF
ncbi:MAG: InlB B-repeat-containing protein, partial [Clostridia bacterium]|nr:InlB B-repeat-containing protein [Clostridia bacterium]